MRTILAIAAVVGVMGCRAFVDSPEDPHIYVHSDGQVSVNGVAVSRDSVAAHLLKAGVPSNANITLDGDGDADAALVIALIQDLGAAGFKRFQDQSGHLPSATVRTNILHVVQGGEDLYSVALMFDVPLKVLQLTNQLSGVALEPGQELIVPVGLEEDR